MITRNIINLSEMHYVPLNPEQMMMVVTNAALIENRKPRALFLVQHNEEKMSIFVSEGAREE